MGYRDQESRSLAAPLCEGASGGLAAPLCEVPCSVLLADDSTIFALKKLWADLLKLFSVADI